MLVELLISLLILSITLLTVLPWFAVLDAISSRMDALALVSANDYAITSSRNGRIVEILESISPKGLWLEKRIVIPGDFEIWTPDYGGLKYKDGYCIRGGTVRAGKHVFSVMPVTGVIVKKR